MSFNFINLDLKEPEVEPVNRDGVRHYPIPGTDKYFPSVTSITSFKNAQFFKEWRTKIGETEETIVSPLALHNAAQHSTTSLKIISKAN